MSRYRDQVATALRAVTIRGPTRYAWLGRPSRRLEADVEAAMDEGTRRAYLASNLGAELYHSFFCASRPVPARWGEPEPAAADPELVAALSNANTGGGGWEDGWTIERVEDRGTVVAAAHVRARIPSADYRALRGLAAGAPISVRRPKGLAAHSPGFYTAFGDAPADAHATPEVVRAYWNVTRAGAPELMRRLTERLNAEQVPFRFKVADHPARLERCDAARAVSAGGSVRVLRPVLHELARKIGPHLRPPVPAFTLELAPGWASPSTTAGRRASARAGASCWHRASCAPTAA